MADKEGNSRRRREGVSPELDLMSTTLMGDAFDALARGEELNVLLVMQDGDGNLASYEFADDGPQACLDAARDKVVRTVEGAGDSSAGIALPVRYAIAYEASIADETGAYLPAVLLEFGERDYRSYSAYSFVDGVGEGEDFRWTDPAPAGELDPLI